MYLTCHLRYLSLKNKVLQEKKFPLEKPISYGIFGFSYRSYSYRNLNSDRIWTKLLGFLNAIGKCKKKLHIYGSTLSYFVSGVRINCKYRRQRGFKCCMAYVQIKYRFVQTLPKTNTNMHGNKTPYHFLFYEMVYFRFCPLSISYAFLKMFKIANLYWGLSVYLVIWPCWP